MKYTKLITLFLSVGMFMSCEKESGNQEIVESSPVYANSNSKAWPLGEPDFSGEAGGCRYGAQYCLTFCCVTVSGNSQLNGLLTAIDNDEAASFLTDAMINNFSNQDTVIGNYMNAVKDGFAEVTYHMGSDSQRVALYFDSSSVSMANYSAALVIDLQ